MKRAKRLRKETPDHFFEGWAFGVRLPAFLSAFDIRFDKPKKDSPGWSQSVPPVYSFSVGDVFYKPGNAVEEWGRQLDWLEMSACVTNVSADALRIAIIEYPDRRNRSVELTPDKFAAFLQIGHL